jgi:hypothetical protein
MKPPEPYLVWRDPDGSAEASPRFALLRPEANRWVRNALLAALILIAIPPTPYLLSPLWLASIVTGWAGAALIALLMVLPLRRFTSWPAVRISVERHQRLGELALVLSAVHTVLLIAGDKLTLEYLWPSQPRWMLAGNAGLIVLALLVVTSLERVRVAVFGAGSRFRNVHVVLAVVLIGLMAAHMVGSGIFIAHPLKAALLALVAAALVATTFKAPVVPPRARHGVEPRTGGGAP